MEAEGNKGAAYPVPGRSWWAMKGRCGNPESPQAVRPEGFTWAAWAGVWRVGKVAITEE